MPQVPIIRPRHKDNYQKIFPPAKGCFPFGSLFTVANTCDLTAAEEVLKEARCALFEDMWHARDLMLSSDEELGVQAKLRQELDAKSRVNGYIVELQNIAPLAGVSVDLDQEPLVENSGLISELKRAHLICIQAKDPEARREKLEKVLDELAKRDIKAINSFLDNHLGPLPKR